MPKRFSTVLLAMAALSAAAERPAFERYQSIVDRQMFGQPPVGFDPSKMPSEVTKSKSDAELTKEQQEVKKAIRFSVINVTPNGDTVVGFSDNGDPKNALHYYLKVGESQNGWTVKAADPESATMTIEKEGIEVTLTLGGDSATEANAVVNRAAEKAASSATSLRARRRQEDAQRKEREDRRDAMQTELLNEMQRLREEREAEKAEKAAAEAAEAEKAAAEAEKKEEEAQ